MAFIRRRESGRESRGRRLHLFRKPIQNTIYLRAYLRRACPNVGGAQTGIWQWSVPVHNFSTHPKNPESRAYLWIPGPVSYTHLDVYKRQIYFGV